MGMLLLVLLDGEAYAIIEILGLLEALLGLEPHPVAGSFLETFVMIFEKVGRFATLLAATRVELINFGIAVEAKRREDVTLGLLRAFPAISGEVSPSSAVCVHDLGVTRSVSFQ